MALPDPAVQRIVLIMLLAFIGVRLSDAHWHVCRDGQEAPVTIHTADASVHHDEHHHEAESHQDRDVEPFEAALLKVGADADQFVVAMVSFVIALASTSVRLPPSTLLTPILRPPDYLRPPLRGPPL